MTCPENQVECLQLAFPVTDYEHPFRSKRSTDDIPDQVSSMLEKYDGVGSSFAAFIGEKVNCLGT